jgi:hypothetical protein
MSHDALKKVLEQLPDPGFIAGTTKLSEQFAIALPDGDVGALDDKMFVAWLTAHSEDAPFGDGATTKRDKTVRNAKRLVARGKADVVGFDPASVLDAIEAALSPRCHLDARLEDVIVYPKGGKFARHKDTPRTPDLVGTLVVGLPIAHEGGQFEIVDGGKPHVVDWSGTPERGSVRWVALFSDLDHAIKPVTSGARVTLVYSLSRSTRARTDAARDKKLAALRTAAAAVKLTKDRPLLIACTRQIVTDGTQPQSIASLRGTDREIADTFVDAGFDVAVRACLVGDDQEGAPQFPPPHLWGITRLSKAVPAEVVAGMGSIVSFTDDVAADDDYGDEDLGATLLGDYVLDMVEMDRWVIRARAAATVIYEGMYSDTGYFGNEASVGHIYSLAAIEVTPRKAKAKPKAKPKVTKKRR